MLSLKNIVKNYVLGKNNEVKVLKNLSLDFREHEFVSILGPSGCGKTTLLNIIGGLDKCTSGDLIVDGVSTASYTASDWDNYRNKKIGFVFQSYNLIPHLNVVRNVEMPLILSGVKKLECRKRAIEVLKTVGLEEQIHKKPLQLSGGQMQRVALARALVTNPDIILADEPTGALDNESSVVVMDLLKKVADERLVIMVTHNDLLAEKYSTRIINLNGGVVHGDSAPYVPEETETPVKAEPEEPVVEDLPAEAENGKKKRKKKKSKLAFRTACELSFRTLIGKKVRTALTSFAGSIGIVGILLVLAFSQGVNGYIRGLEESSLSMYPITIEQAQVDYVSMLKSFQNTDTGRESFPQTDDIYTNVIIGGLLQDFLTKLSAKNDLPALKEYLDANFNNDYGYVKYDYGVTINAYSPDPKSEETFMKTEPFLDVMEMTINEKLPFLASSSMVEMVKPFTETMSSWDEIIDNRKLLENSYELIGNSAWPRQEVYPDPDNPGKYIAEVVIFTDEKNQLVDYNLFMLGLVSENDLLTVLGGDTSLLDQHLKVDDLIGKEYYVLAATDYYDKEDGKWVKTEKTEKDSEFVLSHYSVKTKVVGVARPRKGTNATTFAAPIGYDPSLTDFIMQRINNSELIQDLNATVVLDEKGSFKEAQDVETGKKISYESTYKNKLTEYGVTDKSNPKRIRIYANSFDNKQKITKFLDAYNESVGEAKAVKYSDNLSTIMSFVNTMSDIITKALIGFSSVSLVVSSIMIAVIIYTSVLERRKEVGILRSVGARKGDIVSIFMAESGMLGLFAGLIGALLAWIITLPVNFVIAQETGIQSLANMTWVHAVVMVAVSFALSVFAGVVPAFIGAKQDPAVALRTE